MKLGIDENNEHKSEKSIMTPSSLCRHSPPQCLFFWEQFEQRYLPVICAVKVWGARTEPREAIKSMLFITEKSNNELWALYSCLAGFVILRVLDPFASVPLRTFDLTAFRHLDAVQRIAVAAEQARNEVAATAELATLGVEFLPPILMVTFVSGDTSGLCSSTFCRLLTDTITKIVECIS